MTKIKNVVLIGYRGTGKTTVGRLLAAQLGWAFVDADDEVEQAAGKTISEIFAADGEAAFRDLEQKIVAELTQRTDCVVSLGGGAILRPENRTAIQAAPTVCWLKATAATIHARLQADASTAERRPNLTSQGGLTEIEMLLAQRTTHYQACADFQIDTTGQTHDDIVAAILKHLPAAS